MLTSSSIGFPTKHRLYKFLVVSYRKAARHGLIMRTLKTQDTGLRTQVSLKTAPHLLRKAQGQRVCPEHDSITCWSTRTLHGDYQTTKVVFVLHVTIQISVQECSPRPSRGMSPSNRQKKLHCQYIRVDFSPDK
ncbi:hypothetical protein DPMN_178761 [Dreissena polymorpha]|uniref:Uncharacterized protein n=1 Tax=Dreissena polymorpha TaxID=45954 RepID=A0A9D4IIZ3_DREPO|nr:hypothetical protein DPMN_178761 [Dreissena polymorpha]